MKKLGNERALFRAKQQLYRTICTLNYMIFFIIHSVSFPGILHKISHRHITQTVVIEYSLHKQLGYLVIHTKQDTIMRVFSEVSII